MICVAMSGNGLKLQRMHMEWKLKQKAMSISDVGDHGGTEQVIVDYHTDTPQTVQKKLADLD